MNDVEARRRVTFRTKNHLRNKDCNQNFKFWIQQVLRVPCSWEGPRSVSIQLDPLLPFELGLDNPTERSPTLSLIRAESV